MEPWQKHETKTRTQWLASQAMLTVLSLVRRLGSTTQSAREAGRTQELGNISHVWFDPALFTVNVLFGGRETEDAKELLVSLITNGFHGFVGAFEVDGGAYIADDRVIIPLIRDEAPEPLPVMAGAASL